MVKEVTMDDMKKTDYRVKKFYWGKGYSGRGMLWSADFCVQLKAFTSQV